MSPDEYCQQKAAQSGSSFYYSFLFLPAERRKAITALYAFCREVDDTVDECTDEAVARTKLVWWRKEVKAMYEGNPTHPVMRALQPHLDVYKLEEKHLQAIIDGMEMDLNQTRYLDYQAMSRYCWHVASVVGILSASIFGATRPETLLYAEKLGHAFQLTNIIRDVGEDARKGRIYLPISELQQFNVTAADLLNARHSENFENLMRFQVARAQKAYDEAFALLPAEDRRAQRPGLIMAAIYRTLLNEVERDGYHVLKQRISLTPIRKLWLAWKTWVRG
ncbi:MULTISPECIES: presqualene diphosphate synthase HpnD [Janthinobacterium]|jgi:phytoene synthase|uniref:Presqualene diphosphate synthase HpnD n=1 Tax=Janthinobacterium lividum TaxID=29581 RepID=A0AAJ4T356_9BURK|nr:MULTISPECIES: presqualene diphosphate synthase HpnD [Janthinobacterium]KAB0324962.1 presqualene diphosphate synthase HpnD [Janthinobacterium lividum]MCC7713204.1 presqualene diphosphate synthase HpnD [Janthinobacterium lividum]MDO8033014.1 presqualene diphosphate synthase HpnD [Janthinobacterium sp. SUN128]MDQ4624482.1 presqualene diphosphate synthase HpnD [Janthinobacterium lividum]MDQ4673914.1 presqualene diphosphate synthase HpnD [Janthinobacterium lividum]